MAKIGAMKEEVIEVVVIVGVHIYTIHLEEMRCEKDLQRLPQDCGEVKNNSDKHHGKLDAHYSNIRLNIQGCCTLFRYHGVI